VVFAFGRKAYMGLAFERELLVSEVAVGGDDAHVDDAGDEPCIFGGYGADTGPSGHATLERGCKTGEVQLSLSVEKNRSNNDDRRHCLDAE
jgi:hypothetical protein